MGAKARKTNPILGSKPPAAELPERRSAQPKSDLALRRLRGGAVDAVSQESQVPAPVLWLSDNGLQYTVTATVLYAPQLGLVPITTSGCSSQSKGLAAAFVKTSKRDYVVGAELRDAECGLAQLNGRIDHYNTRAPRSVLGLRSPADYRGAFTRSCSR